MNTSNERHVLRLVPLLGVLLTFGTPAVAQISLHEAIRELEWQERSLAVQQQALRERRLRLQSELARGLDSSNHDRERGEAEAAALARQRQENSHRFQGLAGASDPSSPLATGLLNSVPSQSYFVKVAAKVRPNIIYPENLTGNPITVVEVHAAPDGHVLRTRTTQSSGNKRWDDAVIAALHRMAVLPRDVDGRVPSLLALRVPALQ